MQTYSPTQKYTSIILYVTINVLFYFKYLYRISLTASIVSVLLYLFFSYVVISRYYGNKKLISNLFSFVLIAGYVISCGIVLSLIPKESLNVDRWEMIQVFWDAVKEGIYPYGAQGDTGNYPGPMPFYFILSYPFYLLGEIGYITITGIIIWLCYTYFHERKSFSFMVLLLFSSLAIYWEIFARSTIFFNSCLFALFIFSLKDLKNKSGIAFYLSSVIGGLLLSTRNVFVIVMMLWGIYVLINKDIKFTKLLKWVICFIFSFIVSFVPFILMDPAGFLKMNPFIIQSSVLMPFSFVLFFIALSFVLSFKCRKFTDIIFYSGLLLFLTITGHIMYALYDSGIDAYLTGGADISYYLFCYPFLLKVIADKR